MRLSHNAVLLLAVWASQYLVWEIARFQHCHVVFAFSFLGSLINDNRYVEAGRRNVMSTSTQFNCKPGSCLSRRATSQHNTPPQLPHQIPRVVAQEMPEDATAALGDLESTRTNGPLSS